MPNRPRPADMAVAGNRMIIDLLEMIYQRRYAAMGLNNFGGALELMVVSMMVSVTTRDGGLNATEIGRRLGIPRSNVVRHLDMLEATGTVRLDGKRYVTDFDFLDGNVGSLAYMDGAIKIIETGLSEMKRLRPLVKRRMKP